MSAIKVDCPPEFYSMVLLQSIRNPCTLLAIDMQIRPIWFWLRNKCLNDLFNPL